MRAISQGHIGWYWKTDCPLGLSFNEVEGKHPAPTGIMCYALHDTMGSGHQRRVELDALTFMGAGLYSDERVARTNVTGQSHKYGIYKHAESRVRGVVVIVCHGGGMHGYMIDRPSRVPTWQALCDRLTMDEMWDLCGMMIDAYNQGRAAERSELKDLFLDGRLKKRRRKGVDHMEILPEVANAM